MTATSPLSMTTLEELAERDWISRLRDDVPQPPFPCPTCGAKHPFDNVLCSDGFHAPQLPSDALRAGVEALRAHGSASQKRGEKAQIADERTVREVYLAMAESLRARASEGEAP